MIVDDITMTYYIYYINQDMSTLNSFLTDYSKKKSLEKNLGKIF